MPATASPQTWAPPGFDQVKACEIVYRPREMTCTRLAVWAFRFSCCGYLKLCCVDHWNQLNGGWVGWDFALLCRGCGAEWVDFRLACATSWRI